MLIFSIFNNSRSVFCLLILLFGLIFRLRLICGELFLRSKCYSFVIGNNYLIKNYAYEYSSQKVLRIEDRVFYVSRFSELDFGDTVSVSQIKSFDANIVKINSNKNIKKIGVIRSLLIKKVKKRLPEPYSTYVLGLSIGYKPNLPADIRQNMQKAGIMHVLVVSGFNLGLIFSNLGIVTKRFGRGKFLMLSILFSSIYIFLIGFEAPIIRAFLSFIYQLFESIFGIEVKSWFKLFFINLLMLNFWPYLFFDLSYQFTFIAVLGVDLFSKYRESFKSILITLWMIPITSFYFGEFSLSGLISIPIVVLCVPMATFISIVYAVLPSFLVFDFFVVAILSPLIFLIDFIENAQLGYAIHTDSLSWVFICLIYIFLYLGIIIFKNV